MSSKATPPNNPSFIFCLRFLIWNTLDRKEVSALPGTPAIRVLWFGYIGRSIILEEDADALAVVDSTDGLETVSCVAWDVSGLTHFSKDGADLKHFKLGTSSAMLALIHRVGDHNLIQCAGIDTFDGITRKHTMCHQGVDSTSTLLLQEFRSPSDGVASIGQVVNQDGSLSRNFSYQHHCGILAVCDLGGSSLLMDQSKLHTKRVRNGRRSFCTTCIWTDHDAVLVIRDILLYVFLEEWSAVQVVHWNVEEALILWVVQIHGDNMVSPCAGEEIGNQGPSLGNPLSVPRPRLERIMARELGGWYHGKVVAAQAIDLSIVLGGILGGDRRRRSSSTSSKVIFLHRAV